MFENFVAPEGYSFEYFDEVASTNDLAIARGAGHIVAAGRQTKGRGRMGRAFSSEEGGLYFSMAVKPDCPRKETLSLPVIAAVCVRNAIGGKAKIKWPNDILVEGKKVCGILSEARGGAIVIGFGINLRNALPEELTEAGRVDLDPEMLLQDIADAMAKAVAGYPENRPDMIQEYCNHCVTVMHFVDVTYRGMPLYGFACAVDRYGGLMVMTQESHTIVTVYSGEATLAEKREGEDPDVPAAPRV